MYKTHRLKTFKYWQKVCMKMDGTVEHHVEQSNPCSERQILNVFSHMQNLDLK
jgi:hypothetical protein